MDSLLTEGMHETIAMLQAQYDGMLPDESAAFLICRDCYLTPHECLCRRSRLRPLNYWPIWHVIQHLKFRYTQKGP